jgi:uncharacterized protein (TIGR00290 family)
MQSKLEAFKQAGISRVIFGDIFLEDLRKYREDKLARIDMRAVFPLWQRNTSELALSFIDLGFKAITTCVDGRVLGEGFAGRIIDRPFLAGLPPGADPCGENGEFHSFVFEGPVFDAPVKFKTGQKMLRESFHFCDLIPAGDAGNSAEKERHCRAAGRHLSPCVS